VLGGRREPRPLAAVLRAPGIPPFRLKEGKCVVGSSATADIVISEAGVSRKHLELELDAEGVRVQDLGSRNGTYYLGQRIERAVLALGAQIQVGQTPLSIGADTEALGDAIYASDTFRSMVAPSVAMRRIFATLERLEGSLVTVLVSGESGVGKELIAHAAHDGSPVSAGPLVTVNCGALPRELIGSELFGHKKGAFTGAVEDRKGAFELADGGTLFLDEIGELPLDVQPMLLRALENREICALGANKARRVRVRTIAATNRNLEDEIKGGRFREDLYYRLAVVKLHVPALRERPEDVAPLARLFAAQAGSAELPQTVVEELKARSWPGNVRELRNAVQVFAALGALPIPVGANTATLEMALSDLVDLSRRYSLQKEELSERFTRVYLQRLIAHTAGNRTAAAKIAGLDRSYLASLLVKHGLSRG
jgi:DNA-binding NtrC family response regulator